MKIRFLIILWFSILSIDTSFAQVSRLHVKTQGTSGLGITTGAPSTTKIVGLTHDGTAGVISTSTLDGTSSYSPMKFSTGNAVRMTIFENGFIGINTTGAIAAELTVGGRIHARDVKIMIAAGTGPDYVFKDDYNLPSLEELAAFIKANKHLPDVPAAVEMESNGVHLSEMNMLLLKKVEELTLYLIEQNTKVSEMQMKLDQLQAEIESLSKNTSNQK